MKLRKTILTAAFVFTLTAFPMRPAMAATDYPQKIPMASSSGEISPQSNSIRWIYDIIDGKLYKRLYNASTGAWIGEWIYVRDL